MNNYKIFETNEFIKKLKKIPLSNKAFLENKIITLLHPQLKYEPNYGHNIKKLKDIFPN